MKYFLIQLAQTRIDAGGSGIPKMTGEDLLANGLDLVYFLVGALAVIVIIFAGIMYITSSGDAPKVAKAKNLLTYAIIGLVFVLTAFIITNFVIGSFN